MIKGGQPRTPSWTLLSSSSSTFMKRADVDVDVEKGD